jgi:hypothetical protein
MIGVRCQEGGQGVDRAMTSTVRAGSVTTHALRSEVLQKRIDVRISVDRGPLPFLDSTAMIPRIDGVQMPAVRPSKLACLLIDGRARRGDQRLRYAANALRMIAEMRRGDVKSEGAVSTSA